MYSDAKAMNALLFCFKDCTTKQVIEENEFTQLNILGKVYRKTKENRKNNIGKKMVDLKDMKNKKIYKRV